MLNFDRNILKIQLALFEPWKIITFSLLCCERMFPNFGKFSEDTNFGDALIIRDALDIAWEFLKTEKIPERFRLIASKCEVLTPDTENFGSPLTSAALDAAVSACILMDMIVKPEENLAIEIASLARDTVDMFVQNEFNVDHFETNYERNILSNPLLQQELLNQYEDIQKLKSVFADKLEFLLNLECKTKDRKFSNIGVSMEP